jgi:hypothetical protein
MSSASLSTAVRSSTARRDGSAACSAQHRYPIGHLAVRSGSALISGSSSEVMLDKVPYTTDELLRVLEGSER